jgi:hypothetical protein
VTNELDWALHRAWNTLNKARSSDRGKAEDPQNWTGIEGDLYRALKELHDAAEKAAKGR